MLSKPKPLGPKHHDSPLISPTFNDKAAFKKGYYLAFRPPTLLRSAKSDCIFENPKWE